MPLMRQARPAQPRPGAGQALNGRGRQAWTGKLNARGPTGFPITIGRARGGALEVELDRSRRLKKVNSFQAKNTEHSSAVAGQIAGAAADRAKDHRAQLVINFWLGRRSSAASIQIPRGTPLKNEGRVNSRPASGRFMGGCSVEHEEDLRRCRFRFSTSRAPVGT